MVKVSLFMNLKNEKMDKAELLKNRLQTSIDFAVKMNENLDSSSWNYQEGILLSCNEAKLVVELIKKLTLTDVVKSDSELLHTEVFELANKLAINGYGNEAVKMHGICNGM